VDVPETPPTEAVLRLIPATPGGHPGAKVRLAGDRYIFLEYGTMELDIALRVRCAAPRWACCAVLWREMLCGAGQVAEVGKVAAGG
jgi:hypothetical protein